MHSAKLLYGVAFAAVVALLLLNWQAQRDTRRQLDRLTGSLAVQTEPPSPPAIPLAQPDADPTVAAEPGPLPNELNQVKHPAYVLEPPDVLLVEVVARDPATNTSAALPVQPISGQFVVRPDGTINLGAWGSVEVSGLTLEQATDAVRRKVAESEVFQSLKLPPVSLLVVVDVVAFNSKRYYVITDGDDGEQVFPFPVTGNETVLDAVANIHGLSKDAAKRTMWVARQRPTPGADRQILPVDWTGITQQGATATNYQLLPGDRLYVTAKK